MVLCVLTPLVYLHYAREALCGTEADKAVILFIGLSEHVVVSMMAFVDTGQHGCVLSRIDEFRAYNIPERDQAAHWKALGRVVMLPAALYDAIHALHFLEIVVGCSFDIALALYEFRLMKSINWTRAAVPFFYFNFARSTFSPLKRALCATGRR